MAYNDVMSLMQVLMGYFVIPGIVQNPINAIINPVGDAERSIARIWNAGDQRVRLITCSSGTCTTPN